MIRYLMIFCVLVCGCFGNGPTDPPDGAPTVRLLDLDDVLLLEFTTQVGLDSLPPGLGWPDPQNAAAMEYDDGTSVVLIPLEAEDEVRMLAGVFGRKELSAVLAVGFASTSWFLPARADSVSIYEGWMFCYDVEMGMRRISCYYEGGTLRYQNLDFPIHGNTLDYLADSGHFASLVLTLASPPECVRPKMFSGQPTLTTFRQIADEVKRLVEL